MKNLIFSMTIALLTCFAGSVVAHDHPMWIGTWETSPAGLPSVTKLGSATLPPPITTKGTIRYRLRVSLGGSQIRLRFSNEYGDNPLELAAATVGIAGAGLNAMPGSLRRATFAGKDSITIPAGAPALTDPIELPVKSLNDLVVSVYVPEGVSVFACTADYSPTDQAVVSGSDATREEHLSAGKCLVTIRPLVSEIDALQGQPRKVVVALGDSITDGGVDPKTGERGWPGALSRRLQMEGIAVVNAGIGGNRLLQSFPMFGVSALARLDRDVLSVPGLSHIVLLEGINDIRMSGAGGMLGDTPLVTPEELIAAYSQIVARAHEHGVKTFGATIMPFERADYYSEEKEKVREAVNAWMRKSRVFDGIVDFDAAVRDPNHPRKLRKEYDINDHLHPNPTGYRGMGDAIDLHLFN